MINALDAKVFEAPVKAVVQPRSSAGTSGQVRKQAGDEIESGESEGDDSEEEESQDEHFSDVDEDEDEEDGEDEDDEEGEDDDAKSRSMHISVSCFRLFPSTIAVFALRIVAAR